MSTLSASAATADDASGAAPRPPLWRRVVDNRTVPQRLLLAMGALAAAIGAIGVVVTAAARYLDDPPDVSGGGGGVVVIDNQSDEADAFVRFLLGRAGGTPVQLDHQVNAPRGPANVQLQYGCHRPTGCSVVRVEHGDSIPGVTAGGVWLQGCYAVVRDGAGYGVDALDIELHWRGDHCPG